MKFGLVIPNNWGFEDPLDVVNVAVRAEEMGYDSVWVNHHIFNVGYVQERLGNRPYYDALTTLTYAAALTKRVRLGTTVLVLPYLNPIVLAKALATLDVFSGGRLTVGVGVGAIEQETTALGTDFHRRGLYADESLAIMKELWTQDSPSFDGEFYSFSGAPFSPKPLQKPHPPILIGGSSPGALRRVARYGDGWHPIRVSPESMREQLDRLKAQLDSAGRSLDDISLSVRAELAVSTTPSATPESPLTGTPDQILSAIESFRNLGVDEMVAQVSSADPANINREMETFAKEVMPRAR